MASTLSSKYFVNTIRVSVFGCLLGPLKLTTHGSGNVLNLVTTALSSDLHPFTLTSLPCQRTCCDWAPGRTMTTGTRWTLDAGKTSHDHYHRPHHLHLLHHFHFLLRLLLLHHHQHCYRHSISWISCWRSGPAASSATPRCHPASRCTPADSAWSAGHHRLDALPRASDSRCAPPRPPSYCLRPLPRRRRPTGSPLPSPAKGRGSPGTARTPTHRARRSSSSTRCVPIWLRLAPGGGRR